MRISQKLRGRSFSDSHKQAISDAMKAYWATIPYRPTENNESEEPLTDAEGVQEKNSD
jgi:hypothetical protein